MSRVHFHLAISLIAISLSVFPYIAWGEKLVHHTFNAPFEDIDAAGSRLASPHWRTSGTAEVNKNFIRLTPDRQSKKGALWSRKMLGVPSISTVLQFRISGQGKNFFGDGIGFWITQQGYYTEGTIHGSQERFTGVGIIFDTFKNTENLAAHRDVTVLVNDGTKTYEMMTETVQGCNMNVRYHNARADFSVTDSSSKAKVMIDGNRLVNVFVLRSLIYNDTKWQICTVLSSSTSVSQQISRNLPMSPPPPPPPPHTHTHTNAHKHTHTGSSKSILLRCCLHQIPL